MWYHKFGILIASIGALNWGATALGFNVVEKFLGAIPYGPMAVYLLVGLSGIAALLALFKYWSSLNF